MTGTLAGNILGTIYFAYFQLAGILLACGIGGSGGAYGA